MKTKGLISLVVVIISVVVVIFCFSTPVHSLHWMGYMSHEDAEIHIERAHEQGIFILVKSPKTDTYLPEDYVSVFIQEDGLEEYWENYD